MIFPPHPTELLHTILRGEISDGDIVIDATAGNGHDTLFFAAEVGPSGKVVAIDLQNRAIMETRQKLKAAGLLARVILHEDSHALIANFARPSSVKLIVFNLGYLPGADKEFVTTTSGTIEALTASVGLLKHGGILAAICYRGHPEGAEEAVAVEKFFEALPNHRVARYSLLATRAAAPFLLLARNGRKLSEHTP